MAEKLGTRECASLAEKITWRIQGWQARNLSYAGRLVLIKAFSSNLVNFWTRIFLLPKEVINLVSKLRRDYLWKWGSEGDKAPLIAWDKICMLKLEGGLGLKQSTYLAITMGPKAQ